MMIEIGAAKVNRGLDCFLEIQKRFLTEKAQEQLEQLSRLFHAAVRQFGGGLGGLGELGGLLGGELERATHMS